ncbi:MAG: hypothetical protein V4727_05065 [Verrucomicrobiota bacterium]
MKNLFLLCCLFAVILLSGFVPCFATSVAISTIEQPVNLVSHSDPTRIPLGRVGVLSNYDYGIHYKIVESRPSPQGAMKWKNGSELDQNLATVFGISLEIPDSSQILVAPITIRLNAWKPPAYSPYTKEQVLSATIWCLIRNTGSSPERPLELQVVTESENDKLLESKYSGKYISHPGKDKKIAATTNVGGTTIEEDARGIAWVTLPGTKVDKSFQPLTPAMIITENIGDGDTGWYIMPVWGNGENPEDFLKLNSYSVNMIYSAWSVKGLQNANSSSVHQGGSKDLAVTHHETSTEVNLSYQYGAEESLAANIFALILAQQPTEKHPLIVSFAMEDRQLEKYPGFRKAIGWKESKPHPSNPNYNQLKCEFVWDAKTSKLIKGSIPCVTTDDKKWVQLVTQPEEE